MTSRVYLYDWGRTLKRRTPEQLAPINAAIRARYATEPDLAALAAELGVTEVYLHTRAFRLRIRRDPNRGIKAMERAA